MDFYSTGFIFGLLGSLHCVGMCGAIALSVPLTFSQRFQMLLETLSYNLGRVATYSLIGFVFGLLGKPFQLFDYQQIASITAGVLMLVLYFGVSKSAYFQKMLHVPFFRNQFRELLKKPTLVSLFSLGLLNGILPCGLVYAAAAGAMMGNNAFEGAIYMASFGIGTIPLMVAVSWSGGLFKQKVKGILVSLTPYVVVVMATLFIVRGLGLDIPYLSPKMVESKEQKVNCCH